MGFDYAFVHLSFTIPPALLLTLLYKPLFTKSDLYKICFLISIAVISTTPWDSYLIRSSIWTYPPHAVLGYSLFDIPAEELFFFVIQTYDTSMLYLLMSRPNFYPADLPRVHDTTSTSPFLRRYTTTIVRLGQLLLFVVIVWALGMIRNGGAGTYMGLILIWACPFLLLLWSLSGQFMLRIPPKTVLIPIALPTLYLWLVDTFALRRGTWSISTGTKVEITLWEGLDVEEALFFLLTNVLITFGLIAFDNAVALFDAFPDIFPNGSTTPSPLEATRALLLPVKEYNTEKLTALSQAIDRLRQKSRSFYLASSTFSGRLRVDLVLLYSFCRVADDLVDAATSNEEARLWNSRLKGFIDLAYSGDSSKDELKKFVLANFPSTVQLALLYLPTSRLSAQPLYDLLKGFDIDLAFNKLSDVSLGSEWPVKSEDELELYGEYVAGTVAELCIDLVLYNHARSVSEGKRAQLKEAGRQMGVALQTVNIARDIEVDVRLGRVYIPTIWLKEHDMNPQLVLQQPTDPRLRSLRTQLLDKAFGIYKAARGAIEELPVEARGPMRVAIESYMEIGRVLREESYRVKAGRATVPVTRRIAVAWRALNR